MNPDVPDLDGRLPDVVRVVAEGALRSVFQPIVDLDGGAVVAYEALVRGPEGPLTSPDQLFAAAREAGCLAALDEACRQAAFRGAIEQGLLAPLTLFVNVEPEVLDTAPLDDLLAIASAAPGELRVVVEITERALAVRPADLLRTVQRVRELGWSVALDDVGADAMSLAFMPLLRPDVVKLDLRLVQQRPDAAVAEIMNAVMGRLFRRDDESRSESYADILARAGLQEIEGRGTGAADPAAQSAYAMHAHGAVFAEVKVDPDFGQIRVTRLVGAFAAGTVINPRMVRSQYYGGMIWGVSFALLERAVIDPRSGRIMNPNLGEYHVPVNADVPSVQAILVEEHDEHVNALGIKGVGEIGITGTVGAIANAVWHATGTRVRRFPITLDQLIGTAA